MTSSILVRLDARDRELFARIALAGSTSAISRRAWTGATHLGGVCCGVLLATVPLLFGGTVHQAAKDALPVLVVSHCVVQLIKRTMGRDRPSRTVGCHALVAEPDALSFPSGHAAAAMSVAFGY